MALPNVNAGALTAMIHRRARLSRCSTFFSRFHNPPFLRNISGFSDIRLLNEGMGLAFGICKEGDCSAMRKHVRVHVRVRACLSCYNYQMDDPSDLETVSFDSKFNFMSETFLLKILAPPKLPPGPGVLD